MRLSALVTASAILTLTVSPVFAQGVMVRRPAAAPQTQEAARAESRPESSAAVETKAQEPKAQDPREDIRKIVREELRAALREMRAAEARAAEKKPETAPAKPAPAPEAVAVKPAEPVPATRPMRMRAMQQQQDPAAPKPAPKTEPAKKSQDEVIAELEAELRGIQAEIERSMAAETKPAAKAPAEKQQEPATKPKAREPKAVAVQPSQPAEAKEPVAPRTFSGEVAEGQPRRIMVLRTEETSGEPMVIEMAPEESGRRIERGLRMQAEQDGIRTYRSETRAEQPPGDDRGGCNCDCQCCQQHRGGPAQQREPRAPQARPQQDRISWRGADEMQGDKVRQQEQRGMPMPPMGPMQMDPETRRQVMDRLRAQIEGAQRRLRAMEESEQGQDRGPARDGRGRNVEFRRGRDV